MSLKRGIIPRAPHTEHKATHTWPEAAQTWPKAVHICAKVVHIFFGFVLAFFWGDCVEVVFLFPRSARGSSAGFCGVLVGGCFDEPAASAFTSARAATSPRHLTFLRIAVSSSLNTCVLSTLPIALTMVTMMWMARRRLRSVASATPSCFRDVVLLLLLVDALQNDITNMRLDVWQGPPFSPTQSAIRTQMLQPVYALAPPDRQVVNRG